MSDILAMCINQAIVREFMFSNKRQSNSVLNVYQKDLEEMAEAIKEKYNYHEDYMVTLKVEPKKANVLADGKHIRLKHTETYGDVYTIMPTFHELVNRAFNDEDFTEDGFSILRIPGLEERGSSFPLTMLYDNVEYGVFTENPTMLLESVFNVLGTGNENKDFYKSESFTSLLSLQQYSYNNSPDKTPRSF